MAFCSRCGREIPQGVKFCPDCGAPVAPAGNVPERGNAPAAGGVSGAGNVPAAGEGNSGKRLGPLMGIIAMILGIASLLNHVTVISVGLSIAAIVMGIHCLTKKARLRGFAIAAIVFAVLNFLTYAMWHDVQSAGAAAGTQQVVTGASAGTQKTAGETVPGGKKASSETGQKPQLPEKKQEQKEEPAAEKKEEKQEEKQAEKQTEKQTGVDPELKAFLDEYEDFVDEYVAFMKKYNANPTDMSLLASYASIMQEYADFAEKVDAYDSDSMSNADAAYYIEVTSRCSQKMLRAME